MVSTAALSSTFHEVGLLIAICITIVIDVLAIVYVSRTRKDCHKVAQTESNMGWLLISLAVVDIVLAISIVYLTEQDRLIFWK